MTVLDSSVVVEFLLGRGPANLVAGWIERQDSLVAPDLLVFEVIAALRRRALSGLLSDARALTAVVDLGEAPIELFPMMPLRWRVWELRHNFSAADALFVALAEELGEPLATADAALARAVARHTPVEVEQLG